MRYAMKYQSPVGILTVICSENQLLELHFPKQRYFEGDLSEDVVFDSSNFILKQTKDWLDRYFDGDKPSPEELPLSLKGSEFRQAVWKILCEIPYGKVTTYGDIAGRIAKERGLEKMSAQAVGGAVGHNPIAIIIPCHRVVGANGSLTGFGGGLSVKQQLLAHEGIDLLDFSLL